MIMLKPGIRLKSAVCDTQIMVIKAPAGERALACGGAPLQEITASVPAGAALDPAQASGTQVGKRYVDEGGQFEFLCTKGGRGTLTLDGVPLGVKLAKPLPSSD